MSNARLASIPILTLTCLAIILSVFACNNGDVLAPEPATELGIKNPNFVRILPGEKTQLHPLPAENSSATVSAAQGGSVSCGPVTLVIPAGALDEDTEITIEIEDPVILAAEFGPDGLEFNTPVVMRWNLSGTTAEGKANSTGSLYFNESTQLWEPLQTLSPPDDNTTETELEHFSKYSQTVTG